MTTLAVAIVAGVLGPVVLAWLTGKQRREEKREDWARQDLVAAKAEEAASLLLAQNEVVAKTAEKTTAKLDEIHTLVNSNMTAAMQAELNATIREAALMREVIALHEAAGREPSAEMLAALAQTEANISELQAKLDDRLRGK